MISSSPISIGEAFLDRVSSQPDCVGLIDLGQESWTWQQLAGAVNYVLHIFDDLRLLPGMHIATWLSNSHTWVAIDLGCQLAGLVHVAVDMRMPPSEALKMARHAKAQVLFVPDADQWATHDAGPGICGPLICGPLICGPLIRSMTIHRHSFIELSTDVNTLRNHQPVHPQQAAQILFTSGTSTSPRGVVLSHNNLLSNARAKLAAAPQYATDVRLNVLPFAHAYARTCELSTWILSGSQLVLSSDWQRLLQLAPQVRPSLINLVPHLAHKLVTALKLDANLLGDRMRLLQVGGASLPNDLWLQLDQLGLPPLQGYGLTEASPVVCSNRSGHQRPGTVGQAVEEVELRLDKESVLWTRGPHVMLGYWNSDDETSQKIVDGWLCTGDLAESMPDGTWRIMGRADDVIVLSTGYKVMPSDLINRLGQDPWIEQLIIVGQGRPFVAALVVPRVSELPDEFFSSNVLDQEKFSQCLRQKWRAALDNLPRPLLLERIGVLFEPLTPANGGLNFKGAIRRKFVEGELLAQRVDQLYKSCVAH